MKWVSVATLAVLLGFTVAAFAQTEVPHEFSSGQPARASEVNENFSAVTDAIDANTAAIDENRLSIEENATAIAELPTEDVVVLDFSELDTVVITESGRYVLDRDWDLQGPLPAGGAITVEADDVTIDLRGYSISTDFDGTTLRILGTRVDVRNGTIRHSAFGEAIGGSGDSYLIEDMQVFGGPGGPIALTGNEGSVRDSTLTARFGVRLTGNGIQFERNRVLSSVGGGLSVGAGSSVIDNRITGGDTILTLSDNTVIARNTIVPSSAGYIGIAIAGMGNLVHDNHVGEATDIPDLYAGISVSGNDNILDGNIILSFDIGIQFAADGNFYGNNRAGTTTAFDLGATTQTDWGGNVSF